MIFIEQLPSIFEYHKNTKELNLQAITVWVTHQKFIIVPNLTRSLIPTILQIHRSTHLIQEHPPLPEERYNTGKPHFFSCFIGIVDLSGKKVMLLAEEVIIVANIGKRDIFRIIKPIYMFYDQRDRHLLTQKQTEILLNITALFQQGIYFSYSYDLGSRLSTEPMQGGGMFNWAGHIQADLQKFDRMWRLSMIQGFVGRLELHINGVKMSIVLISRRAVKRGGAQSYARGIDREGNAGNYVQTQQIIIMKDHYFSFLQARGSAPCFWGDVSNNYGISTVKCEGSVENNYMAFKKHLRNLHNNLHFQDIFLINLMSSMSEEKKLIENYQFLVRKLQKEDNISKEVGCQVKYAYFDLHARCINKEYDELNTFLQIKMEKAVHICGFTALNIDRQHKTMQTLTNQSGTFRTNCYNCIDRTNIVQSRIAALKLMEILQYLEIEINQFKNGLAFFASDSAFSNLYRNLWADNGDALSKQYTGTGSTESFAVRKGKLSYLTRLDHGMKSIFRVIRMIRNEDRTKQEAICFILGQEMEGEQQKSNEVTESSSRMREGYSRLNRLKESKEKDGYKQI